MNIKYKTLQEGKTGIFLCERRHFYFLNCETQTSKGFKWEQKMFRFWDAQVIYKSKANVTNKPRFQDFFSLAKKSSLQDNFVKNSKTPTCTVRTMKFDEMLWDSWFFEGPFPTPQ